jgi:hypothetical protein
MAGFRRSGDFMTPKPPAQPTFSQWSEKLLIALADRDSREPGNVTDLEDLAKSTVPFFQAGWVRKAHDVFSQSGWISGSKTIGETIDAGQLAFLTGLGLQEAERLGFRATPSAAEPINLEHAPPLIVPTIVALPVAPIRIFDEPAAIVMDQVPASDRIVRLDDNAPGRADAIEALEKIEALLVSGSNDLALTADERMVVLSEISPLRQRLESKIVRIGEFVMAVSKGAPLVWLADKMVGTIVGSLALAAIAGLVTLARLFAVG